VFKMNVKISYPSKAYKTLMRIEQILKELRDGETQLERTMLRIRIAQAELGNLKQFIKYEVNKDD